MRFLIKSTVWLAVFLGVAGYSAYLMTGRAPWVLFELPAGADIDLSPELPQVPDSVSDALPAEKEIVYKWRDAEGVLQYSNRPPPEGVDARVVEINPDTNMIGAVRVSEQPDEDQQSKSSAPPARQRDAESPRLYSPKGVKKLFDDARDAKKQLEARDRARRELLDGEE